MFVCACACVIVNFIIDPPSPQISPSLPPPHKSILYCESDQASTLLCCLPFRTLSPAAPSPVITKRLTLRLPPKIQTHTHSITHFFPSDLYFSSHSQGQRVLYCISCLPPPSLFRLLVKCRQIFFLVSPQEKAGGTHSAAKIIAER